MITGSFSRGCLSGQRFADMEWHNVVLKQVACVFMKVGFATEITTAATTATRIQRSVVSALIIIRLGTILKVDGQKSPAL